MPALSTVLLTSSFQFSLLFFYVGTRKPGSCRGVRGFPNIGHQTLPKMWELGKYVPCTRCTSQGTDFELIKTVKMGDL